MAEEVGVLIIDLYEYVVDFCKAFPSNPAGGPFANNYTSCAIQYTMVGNSSGGLHFYNQKPHPSGQQYTAIVMAKKVLEGIPEHFISNRTTATVLPSPSDHWQCNSGPAPLSTTEPNVLVIDGNGIDYGAGVECIFEEPGVP